MRPFGACNELYLSIWFKRLLEDPGIVGAKHTVPRIAAIHKVDRVLSGRGQIRVHCRSIFVFGQLFYPFLTSFCTAETLAAPNPIPEPFTDPQDRFFSIFGSPPCNPRIRNEFLEARGVLESWSSVLS